MARLFEDVDWKVALRLLGLFALVTLLWNTPLVWPLKILVVFFHEMSHGMMAVLTGGEVLRIEVVAQEGGLCLSRGGSRFLTLTAGYLGSLLWGGLLLVLSARTNLDRMMSVVLGVVLLLVSVFLVRPFFGFGFLFGIGAALALLAMGLKLPARINDFVLRLVGLTSCLYAVLDIKSDIIDRPQLQSDAAMLAQATGLPTLLWGVVWIVIAAIGAAVFLLLSCKRRPATGRVMAARPRTPPR